MQTLISSKLEQKSSRALLKGNHLHCISTRNFKSIIITMVVEAEYNMIFGQREIINKLEINGLK